MDFSRLTGPFVQNDDQEQILSHDNSNTGDYLKDYYQSSNSADSINDSDKSPISAEENFLVVAQRLLGQSNMVSLQHFNEELKNAENQYLQFQGNKLHNECNKPANENEEVQHVFPHKKFFPGPKENINEISSDVVTKATSITNMINEHNEANQSKFPNDGHVCLNKRDLLKKEDFNDLVNLKSENFIETGCIEKEKLQVNKSSGEASKNLNEFRTDCKKLYQSLESNNSEPNKINMIEMNTASDSDSSDTEGDSNAEEINIKEDAKKQIEKTIQENISIKFDKESGTFICVRREKQDKLLYKVNASQHDPSITSRELPYKCRFCDEAFSLFTQLKRHTEIHSQDSPFTCQSCGRVYRNDAELKKHMKKHDRLKPHTCTECGKSFRQLHMLQNHTRTHSGEKPFLCETCGQGFGQKENLKLHERTHTGVKPHKCAICSKTFNNTKCLHRHELTHSGERNYRCDTCGKCYLRNDHLRRHKRSHGEEPRFKCSHCGKGFHQKVNVVEHERIHTGDKPFVCEVCGKSFTQRGNLKSHLIKHSFV